MNYQGVLTKMQVEHKAVIQYYLIFKDDFLHVNQLLDKTIVINHTGFQCLSCGKDKKIFRQGFCYQCFYEIPQAADWIIKPELSKAHLNQEERDLEYEKSVQLQPHIVYLANSSNVKVGVTRKSQIPTRWIDQGAHKAIALVEVPNRYLAGVTEVALKAYISDKTNWRKMLKNDIVDQSLLEWKSKLKEYIPAEARPYFIESNLETHLNFPVLQYPDKPKSLNLDKTASFTGKLKGIKGQYLIFEDQTVFNVRGNEGYKVELVVS